MSVLDGYTVQNIPSPGVGVPVYENPADCVWSIFDGGFQRYDSIHESWERHSVPGVRSESTPFFPISEGRIAYLIEDRLMEWNAQTRQNQVLQQSEDGGIGSYADLIPNSEGGIWVAGDTGLARFPFNPETGQWGLWREYPIDVTLNARGLHHLTECPTGKLFGAAVSQTSSNTLLLQFYEGQWSIIYEPSAQNVNWGWETQDKELWAILHPFSILYLFQDTVLTVESNKVLSRVLLDAALDRNGSFWLATSEGLARHAPPAWSTPLSSPRPDQIVHSIRQDADGRLWFLCSNHLACYHQDEWSFYPLPPGEQSDELNTESLLEINSGFLVKTTKGALIFYPDTGRFTPLHHPDGLHIALLAAHLEGVVWILAYNDSEIRLEQYDGQSWNTAIRQENRQNLDTQLRHVFEDTAGAVWLAGLNGLVRYQDGRFHRFDARDGYTDSAANCIHSFSDRRLWVGGRDSLFEYNGETWRRIQSGLDGVRSIQTSRNGDIWVASGTGLHRFRDGSWIGQTYEEGLPNAAVFEIYEDRENRIWAGTSSGLALYRPAADIDPPDTDIPEDKNFHEIGPSGAPFVYRGMDKWNYTRSNRLLFSYRIDDEDWSSFTSETEKSFADLSPGKHRFEVRAMDRNGNIDPTPAVYPFTVLLPWYKEPAFLFILGLCGLSLAAIAGLIGWIVYSAQHQNRLLAQLVAERTTDLTQANKQLLQDAKAIRTAYDKVLSYQKQLQELAQELTRTEERERRRLAVDLHDSIGQSLALAAIKLEGLLESLRGSESSLEIERLIELVEQTLQYSRTLTFELCPPILYEVGLEAAIEQLTDRMQALHGLQVRVVIDCDCSALSDELRFVLFRSLGEILMNVVKHAKTSSATLNIRREGEFVHVEVRDRGPGFDPDTQPVKTDRFGLFSIGERLKQIGGRLIVQSAPGQGTCVILTAPIGN